MITGLGIDIVEIDRIAHIVEKWTEKFLQRIFTEREIEYCRSKPNAPQHFAARFAAKEAFAKAITTGWNETFHWKDVEVENEFTGQPRLVLHGGMAERFSSARIHLSLSHTHTTAAAVVILERREE